MKYFLVSGGIWRKTSSILPTILFMKSEIYENNVTLLISKNNPLNKSYTLDEHGRLTSKSKKSKYFKSESMRFGSIYDIWKGLKWFCEDSHKSIIRGISDNEPMDDTRRTIDIFKEPDSGTPWVMLDLDDVDVGKRSPVTPKSIEYSIREYLPKEFQNTTYVYQFSNSSGFQDYKCGKTGLNVHLYFYLDRNVYNDELKEWLKGTPVDKSLFCPVQYHFTSLPDFDDVVLKCKVKKRQNIVKKGSDTVKVPEIILNPINKHTGRRKKPVDEHKVNWKTKTKDIQIFGEILDEVMDREGLIFNVSEELEGGVKLIGDCPYHHLHTQESHQTDFNVYITSRGRLYTGCFHTHCKDSLKRLNGLLNDQWKGRDLQPYYDQSGRLDLETGEIRLKLLIKDFSENPKDIILKAECSIGKTEEVIQQIIKPDRRVFYLVPQHKLSEELIERVKKNDGTLKTTVIKGRNQEGMCLKSHIIVGKDSDGNDKRLIEELPKKGKSVFESLCRKTINGENGTGEDTFEYCKHYSDCPYIQQYIESEDSSLVVMTHDSLVMDSPKPLRLPDPDILVIDESFWKKFYEFKSFTLGRLKNYCNDYTSDDEYKVLDVVSDSIYHQKPILKYLRDNGVTRLDLEKTKDDLSVNHRRQSFSRISPDMDEESMIDEYKDIRNPPPYYELLKCLLKEWDMDRDFCHSIKYQDSTTVLLQYRKNLKRFKYVPTLVIDADGEKRLIEKCLDKKFEYEEIKIKMKDTTTVTQSHSKTFYTSGLLQVDKKGFKGHNIQSKETIKDINRLIKVKSEGGNKKVLVISPLKVELLLEIPEGNCESVHFNNFRGLDGYSSFDVVIVVGRNQMKVTDLERIGRSIFFDDDRELELIEGTKLPMERRRYSTSKDNIKSRTVQVQYHPDERIDGILKQTRENESVQGCYRIRPLRGEPKEIILLSNLPVDLEVDDLVDWKTYRTEFRDYS
jgi:hypothetical protein